MAGHDGAEFCDEDKVTVGQDVDVGATKAEANEEAHRLRLTIGHAVEKANNNEAQANGNDSL
jgi:hypothetical protein